MPKGCKVKRLHVERLPKDYKPQGISVEFPNSH